MIAYVSIPALVALIFKLVLLVYTARSPVKNLITRLFLALLVALTLINIVEIFLLNYFPKYGLTPIIQASGFTYVALLILAGTIILHLSIALSFEESSLANRHWLIFLLYAPALALDYLLLFTDELVPGFTPFSYSILRIPGPWYWIVESFAVLYLIAILLILLYGARSSRPALLRIRNRLWLLGLAPMVIFLIHIVIVDYIGWTRLGAPVHLPITITFFLLVTTYATHEHPRPGGFYRFLYRLFDIEFYLPWSKLCKRKTALYRRIERMIAELGDSYSSKDIVNRLSDTFLCPVVWIGGLRPMAARAGEAPEITRFPRAELGKIHRLLITHQIAQSRPDTHVLMKNHGVAAIVPFHPHSKTAASWMLLGESFSEQVYTPQDLEMAQTLFDRLADYFIDQQMLMRAQLSEARQEMRALYQRLTNAWDRLETRREGLKAGKAESRRLRKHATPSLSNDFGKIQSELLEQEVTGKKTLDEYTAAFEARVIARALEYSGGNQAKAAALLGLRPNTLYYKIRRYRLTHLTRGE